MVQFDLLPSTTRGPLAYVETRPSRKSAAITQKPMKVLLVGQKTTGSKAALGVYQTTSAEEAQAFYGAGSQLHEMFVRFFQNNKATEVFGLPVADNGSAVAEIRTITITGTVTAAGRLVIYGGGYRVTVNVAKAEVNNTTATNLGAALTAEPNFPFTVSVATNVVTITAKNKGTLGGEITVEVSPYPEEPLPAGLSLAFAVTTPGTGAVDYAALAIFGAIPSTQFDVIAVGANDSTNLTFVTDEMLDRWGPTRMIEGVVLTGFKGNLAACLAQGALLNSQFSATLGVRGTNSSSWAIAGALAGAVAFHGGQDPARPFHTIPLKGILTPSAANQWTQPEREQLLHGGIATYVGGGDGSFQIHRLISNYRLAPGGAADATYLDLNTVMTLALLRYSWRTNLLTKYPRHKLANDGTRFAAGQPIMTPERGRAEAVAWFGEMEAAGYVEDVEQFKADLEVVRNGGDPNRLDFLLPINLVNQLQVIGTQIEFTL